VAVKFKSKDVSVSELFCDKISLVANLPNDADYEHVHEYLPLLGKDNTYGYVKPRPGYLLSAHLCTDEQFHLLPWDRRTMLFQLKSDQPSSNHIRMEFNPAKDDMSRVRELVEFVTGCSWEKVIGLSRVTRFDMAVDISGIDINSLAASCKYSQKRFTVSNKKGEIETIKFGTRKSQWAIQLYDKAKQSKLPGKLVRIEASYRPKKSHLFKYMQDVENPFSRLTVDSMVPITVFGNLTEFDRFFIKVAKHEGLKNALDTCDPDTRKQMEKRLSKYWNDWLAPEQLWQQWNDVIHHLESPPASTGFID
jgi:hypothetical protein